MSGSARANQDHHELDLLLRGFQVSRMLRLVADLGIADKIARDGDEPIDKLAASCGVMAEPLTRVIRALASFRVFQFSSDGRVSHTPRSLLLRTDTPNSLHHAARAWTGPGSWKAWGELDVAMTGGSPHEAAWGTSRFSYLNRHPDEARAFDAMMANFPDNRHLAISEAYDFGACRLIADVGGGNGATLRRILEHHPAPRGLLFDREDVVAGLTHDDLMAGRITAKGGNFFEQVPHGADTYMLVRTLHDWSDEDCLKILGSCRSAIGKDGTLLIGEQVLEPDPIRGRPIGYLIDTHMMAMFGRARERTADEFRGLLDRTGFTLTRVIPTESPVSIIEARPVTAGV